MLSGTLRLYAMTFVFAFAFAACSGSSDDENTNDATGQADEQSTPDTTVEDNTTPQDVTEDETTQVDEVVEETDQPDTQKPDGFHTGISAEGYGEFCREDAECSQWDLTCFNYGPEDVRPICSKACETNYDCPEYYVCQWKTGFEEPVKVCMKAPYCSECQDDIQCQLGSMKCVEDLEGGQFCTYKCNPGVPGCPAGSHCVYNQGREDWYCQPFYGTCLGGGEQCSPCVVENDCSAGHHCISLAFDGENFCSKECSSYEDCPEGHDCFDLGAPTGLCLMYADGQGIPGCHAKNQGFCHECKFHWECEDGMACYVTSEGTGYYCAHECKASSDCEGNTACAGSWLTDTGFPEYYLCALKEGYTCKEIREDEMGLQ